VFTKYDIHSLAEVVIANPTLVDLLPQFYANQGFVASDATQPKKKNYCN
jgi:hypothetical protein